MKDSLAEVRRNVADNKRNFDDQTSSNSTRDRNAQFNAQDVSFDGFSGVVGRLTEILGALGKGQDNFTKVLESMNTGQEVRPPPVSRRSSQFRESCHCGVLVKHPPPRHSVGNPLGPSCIVLYTHSRAPNSTRHG